jgi:hypothetical protein
MLSEASHREDLDGHIGPPTHVERANRALLFPML